MRGAGVGGHLVEQARQLRAFGGGKVAEQARDPQAVLLEQLARELLALAREPDAQRAPVARLSAAGPLATRARWPG